MSQTSLLSSGSFLGFLKSSIGQKFLVGVSGLAISGFALSHMLGNLLLFKGPEAYNKYGHALVTNPVFPLLEMGLLAVFLMHIGLTIKLAISNKAAREVKYAVAPRGAKKMSLATMTMILSGALMLAFLVLHLLTFRFGPNYRVVYDGVEMRDLYRMVYEAFQNPLYVGWYVLSMGILFMHLSHGIRATFQSLGFFSANKAEISKIGFTLAAVIALGFMSQPIYIFLLK
jgi:succinate dehydrogenase / fumarate reductase cytochrome b subunit